VKFWSRASATDQDHCWNLVQHMSMCVCRQLKTAVLPLLACRPLTCCSVNTFACSYPPVHNCLKFSAARGASLVNNTMVMRPWATPLMDTSKYTSGSSGLSCRAASRPASAASSRSLLASSNRAPDVQLTSGQRPQEVGWGEVTGLERGEGGCCTTLACRMVVEADPGTCMWKQAPTNILAAGRVVGHAHMLAGGICWNMVGVQTPDTGAGMCCAIGCCDAQAPCVYPLSCL
jgi:hypothetical protein